MLEGGKLCLFVRDMIFKKFIAAGLVLTLNVAAVRGQDDSTVLYELDYFEPYKPVTLEDMIRAIPGGTTVINDLNNQRRNNSKRGFGSSGAQFLINGKRMSGKSNDISKQLARIQVSQVDHIELIRGTAEGLDIQNQGILFNVILKEGAGTSTTSLKLKGNYAREAGFIPEFLFSHNGSAGRLDYGVSYEYDTWVSFQNVKENLLDGNRVRVEYRPSTRNKRSRINEFAGNLKYDFENGDVIRINGLLNFEKWRNDIWEDQLDVAPDGGETLALTENRGWDNDEDKWEIGGDYVGEISGLGTLKALFVINRSRMNSLYNKDHFIGGEQTRLLDFQNDFVASEKIFRASLSKSFGRHTLDYGAEGAFNKLDKTVTINQGTPDNTVVRESRYELFVTYSVALRENINFQASLIEEFSKITQSSAGAKNERSFKYLKPRFEARYDLTSQDQFRMTAERTVSQLNLNNFIISRNDQDDTFNFGNPDLVQEKLWTYSLSYERRFANDGGSVELKAQYEDYSDKLDKILIGEDSSGIGNIGDASRWLFNAKSDVRLSFFHMPEAVLTMNYSYKNSKTIDPFTGLERVLRRSPAHFWSVNYQHDVFDWDFTYGFNYQKRSVVYRYDVNLESQNRSNHRLSLFTEYRFSRNMKLRFDLQQIFNGVQTYEATYYDGHILNGIIDRIEVQDQRQNRFAMLTLQLVL